MIACAADWFRLMASLCTPLKLLRYDLLAVSTLKGHL
jgi:hypothetical protein